MEIKKIIIKKLDDGSQLKAFVEVETDIFRLWDVKVLERGGELMVALPSKKKKRDGHCKYFPYIRFSRENWDKLKHAVIEEYLR